MSSRKQKNTPLGGRYRQVSLFIVRILEEIDRRYNGTALHWNSLSIHEIKITYVYILKNSVN